MSKNIQLSDLSIKEVQCNFLDKMDCLIVKIDTDIKINKRKRFLNKIKNSINEENKR